MYLTRIVFSVALIAALGACSKGSDSSAQPASAPATESKDSTSLSIDTGSGAVSFESEDGADKTSISVGGDDKK